MKTLSTCCLLAAAVAIASCSSHSSNNSSNNTPPDINVKDGTVEKIAVDATGAVQSTVTVAHPTGSKLTLFSGTQITYLSNGEAIDPPSSSNIALVLAVSAPDSSLALPSGITPFNAIRILLFVDGVEREAVFSPPPVDGEAPAPTVGAKDVGLKLTIPVDSSISAGTLAMLYDVSSGTAVSVGSSAIASSSTTASSQSGLARSHYGLNGSDGGAGFNPPGTGSYASGGAQPPPNSPPVPEGSNWTKFTVADPGCITVDTVQVCGPWIVDRVSIVEPSTAEILGICMFGGADSVATAVYPPGYQYWCQRPSSGVGDIIVSSPQASNLPMIGVHLSQAETGLSAWDLYAQASGGVHTPKGELTDPYTERDLKFAGHKQYFFTTKEKKDYNWMRQHAVDPLRNKGYEVVYRSFEQTSSGSRAEVNVNDTLDARVKMEEDVIKKEHWKVGGGTKGNLGNYEFAEVKWKGTAHAVMKLPVVNALVWEITAEVTFTKNSGMSTKDVDVYDTAEGTVTQVAYTVPAMAGGCTGDPATFTNTYPIFKGDGYLSIKSSGDTLEYQGSASISGKTPLEDHPYTQCCPFGDPPCTSETLKKGEQEHEWFATGRNTWTTATSDTLLEGSYADPHSATYDWSFTKIDENAGQ